MAERAKNSPLTTTVPALTTQEPTDSPPSSLASSHASDESNTSSQPEPNPRATNPSTRAEAPAGADMAWLYDPPIRTVISYDPAYGTMVRTYETAASVLSGTTMDGLSVDIEYAAAEDAPLRRHSRRVRRRESRVVRLCRYIGQGATMVFLLVCFLGLSYAFFVLMTQGLPKDND